MNNADTLLVKLITVLIYSTLGLLVLSFLLVFSFPLFLNPDHYKTQIADFVLEKTGRTMTFSGSVELDLFPDPSLTLTQISLSNAPGFGPEPMVKIDHLHGKLHLGDLLSWQVVMENFVVTGVELFLERSATGQNNWDDLMVHAMKGQKAALPDGGGADSVPGSIPLAQLGVRALGSLSARSITLREGSVRACQADASAEQGKRCLQATHLSFTPHVRLSNPPNGMVVEQVDADLTLQEPPFVGHVNLSYHQPVQKDSTTTQWHHAGVTLHGRVNIPSVKELELVWRSDVTMGPEPDRLHIAQADSTLTVWSDLPLFRELTWTLKGAAEVDLHQGRLSLPQGGLTWRIKSDQLPPAGVELAFQSAMEMDWQKEHLSVVGLQVTGPAQMRLEGSLQGHHLLSQPSLDVELTALHFDPRALLVALGRSVPPTTDPTAIHRAAGSAVIHLDGHGLAVTRMVLEMDRSRLTGNISWQAGGGTSTASGDDQIRFDLQGDQLTLDGYLPPEWTDLNQAEKRIQAVIAPELLLPHLPVEWLQHVDLQGNVRLDLLKVADVPFTHLALDVAVHDRQLELKPYRLTLYDGEMESRLVWDDRGDEPTLTLDKTATNVQMEPLLALLPYGRWLVGRADLVVHGEGQGREADRLWKNMQGNVAVMVHEGAVQGIDLAERFRESHAAGQEKRLFGAGVEKPSPDKRGSTPFSQLTGTARLAKGVMENKDLRLVSPALAVTGQGWVDWTRASVEYTLEVDGMDLLPNPPAASGQRLILPVRFQGDLSLLKAPVFGTMRSQ